MTTSRHRRGALLFRDRTAASSVPSELRTARASSTANIAPRRIATAVRNATRSTGTLLVTIERMNRRNWIVLACLLVAAVGCHNTAQGVKADTKKALDKTGEKLERAGDKIDKK
jgi:hypothetical protein